MSMNPIAVRKYLATTALVVSAASIGYLVQARPPADAALSDLVLKINGIEASLATLKEENQAIKEDGRLLRVLLENTGSALPRQEGAAETDSAAQPDHPGASLRPAPGAAESARKNWIATEYPRIVEKSQANANSMVNVLDSETNISKDKLPPMKSIFSEASVRIANALANADDMSDVKAINGKISEVNQWKDEALSSLLSKDELEQYKSINWMKKLGAGDRADKK